jgi:hypothetical protein
MYAEERRSKGWLYTVVGPLVFVGGMISLLDPSATRIYVGAIVVGPILFARGLHYLREYYGSRESSSPFELREGQPAEDAAQLYDSDLRGRAVPCSVTCASCQQEYVFFPVTAEEARAAHYGPRFAKVRGREALETGEAVAPCPRCAWIQPNMIALARLDAPVSVLYFTGIFVLCGAAFYFIYIISNVILPGMEHKREVDDVDSYFLVLGLLLLVGFGMLVGGWLRRRRWDPNTQSENKRLRLARQVSLTREEYLRLAPDGKAF